jgi:penicillin-binding protein 2
MDPATGEVLAMTSLPSYDPNQFAVGMDGKTWGQLLRDPLKPMNNRLVQGTYSPGSTFKMVVALAALEEKIVTPQTTFYCPGHATFYGHRFGCWKKGGHGTVDMRRAIEQSCNVYFYNLGDRLGVDRINKYAAMFGLVGKTGIDLPGEVESLVPSTAWKQRVFKDKWYAGETISVAIGQGAVSVTPLGMGTMIATIANGGTLITPHVARAFDAGDGRGWQPVTLPPPRSQLAIAPENLQAVRDGLWLVVNGAGTGGRARIPGRDVSGKTGTSQLVSNKNKAAIGATGRDVRDNGWFVFFAPRDNPKIAGVVFAEGGEHGSEAAPIAKHVMETFFAKQDGQPLPKLPPKPGVVVAAATAAPGAKPPASTTGAAPVIPAPAASAVGGPARTAGGGRR